MAGNNVSSDASFKQAIGNLSISWALAEHALDICIAELFYLHGGDKLTSALPMNANAKIRFFRRAVKHAPDNISKWSKWSDEIADKAYLILEERNWCIHGVALRYFSLSPSLEEDSRIELTRLPRVDLGEPETKEVSIRQINYTANRCLEIAVALANFLHRPLAIVSDDSVKNAFRRIGKEPPF